MGRIRAGWGLGGIILLIGSAVYRLIPPAINAFDADWSWYHWVFLVIIVPVMAYAEGFRAFQRAFSPRAAARARYLMDHPHALRTIFAPFFCMAYFHAPRRRRVTSLAVTGGVIVLVILVRMLAQPWRGIIDIGVLVGLAWGLVSLAVYGCQAFTGTNVLFSTEVPDHGSGDHSGNTR